MAEKDKQTVTVRFNTAYYLAKNKRPHSECGDLLILQEKDGVKTSDMYHNETALQVHSFVKSYKKILKNATISLY